MGVSVKDVLGYDRPVEPGLVGALKVMGAREFNAPPEAAKHGRRDLIPRSAISVMSPNARQPLSALTSRCTRSQQRPPREGRWIAAMSLSTGTATGA